MYLHHDLHSECVSSTRQGPIGVIFLVYFSTYNIIISRFIMEAIQWTSHWQIGNEWKCFQGNTTTSTFRLRPQLELSNSKNHVDVKISSEHAIFDKRYIGELTIWHLHPDPDHDQCPGQDVNVKSLLFDIHPQGLTNLHLQKAINKWKVVFEENDRVCQNRNFRRRRI